MVQISRQVIDSSAIVTAGFCPQHHFLDLEFRRDRKVYRYFGVPTELWQEMLTAESIGQFFQARIRDAFRCARLAP